MRFLSYLFRAGGWIIGAIAVLAVIEDFDLIRLHGFVLEWIRVYQRVVGYIFENYFYWIRLGSLRIDEDEMYFLTVSLFISVAFARYYWHRLQNVILDIIDSEVFAFIKMIFMLKPERVFLIYFLLPFWLSLPVMAFFLGVSALIAWLDGFGRMVAEDTIGMLTTMCVLILLSNMAIPYPSAL